MDRNYAIEYFNKIIKKCGGYGNISKALIDGIITIGESIKFNEAEIALGIESTIKMEANFKPYVFQ